jgi:hypothetical protein
VIRASRDDGVAGTVFLHDQRIRHPDDLGSRACVVGSTTLRERLTQERPTRTFHYFAEALAGKGELFSARPRVDAAGVVGTLRYV